MLNIENIFTFHPVKQGQAERYQAIREKAKELAYLIAESTPASPEQTLAIRSLSMAVMQANSAIAINE